MTEVKFSGAATVTGFPRDKAFGFEVEGDKLIIKAGKETFLTIEKEALVEKPVPVEVAAASHVVAPTLNDIIHGHEAPVTAPVAVQTAQPEEKKERKPRSPNVQIDEASLIFVDPNRANPYSKLRGKYYETLKTANGRAIAWWKDTSMVKSLEGNALTMLKFFLSEGVVQLQAPAQGTVAPQAQQQVASNVTPIQPSFGGAVQGQPQVAGPIWSPQPQPGQPVPGQGNGPTFM